MQIRKIAFLLAVGCFVWSLPQKTKAGLGLEVEKFVGQSVASNLESRFRVSYDSTSQAQVENIALRLASLAPRKGINYQLKILNSDEVNAYAVMGGSVYVTEGLLRALGFASNEFDPLALLRQIFGGGLVEPIPPAEDELAFILAHEITHIKEKHGVKQAFISVGALILLGKLDPKKTADAAALIGAQLLISGRSRDDEREADAKGVELMEKAGYDPAGALAVMRRMETLRERQKDPTYSANFGGLKLNLDRFFATHPPTEVRSEVLKDYLIKSRTGFTWKDDIVQAASVSSAEQTWVSDGFDFPLGDPASGTSISQHFQALPPEAYMLGHLGDDFRCPVGTPIYSISNGRIVYVADDKGTGDDWGNCLIISHQLPSGEIVYSQYAHLSKIFKREGIITRRELIGESGKKGTGHHLHFEIKSFLPGTEVGLGLGYSGRSQPGESVVFRGVTYYNPSEFIRKNRVFSFQIVQSVPQNGSVNVSHDSDIIIEFSQSIADITVGKAVRITGESEVTDIVGDADLPTPPTPKAQWSVDGNVLRGKNWYCEPYTRYIVTITSELRNTNRMSLREKFVLSFSTGPLRGKILLEKGPQHLGDDEADSKTIWLKRFALTAADLANRSKAKISLLVKGTPRKDPIIFINRQEIGRAITQTGEWETFEFPFDVGILQEGNNLIDLETVIANLWQTFDECEFADVYLLLE